MFPLDFPLGILGSAAQAGEWVLDPFCGRGTTNFAARLLGLPTIGVDSSPVAVALSQAKLVSPSVEEIMDAARRALDERAEPEDVPCGEFWELAYHQSVLKDLCRLREALLADCRSPARIALRAIILGALHGPQSRSYPSYFSNQAPRTYAPKPAYSVRFWRENSLLPRKVDVLEVIRIRAERYYGEALPSVPGQILSGDSRNPGIIARIRQLFDGQVRGFSWVITSPPYFGMKTYVPDQWVRNWFLGGPPVVDYSVDGQMSHTNPEKFCDELHETWKNVGALCTPGATMAIRFGCINSRKIDPLEIMERSLAETGWAVHRVVAAGSPKRGKRQADHFLRAAPGPPLEIDVYAMWEEDRRRNPVGWI
ncbi:MAG TPA: site-specific DNA-methyltransferase [Firmicutes bacterium]|nr:site-specific DNA-methyltransferase [Bacillota bacterium]